MSATTTSGAVDLVGDGGVLKKCHYDARLLDGTRFDSSRARREPYEFPLGAGRVIKGWELGVASMRVGERAQFTIKPEYAYGDEAPPDSPIPKRATLCFDVELLRFDDRRDVSARKTKALMVRSHCAHCTAATDTPHARANAWQAQRLEAGAAARARPAAAPMQAPDAHGGGDEEQVGDDDDVRVRYELRAADDSTVLEREHEFDFRLGEQSVPPALEQAVRGMTVGERLRVDVTAGDACAQLAAPAFPADEQLLRELPAEWAKRDAQVQAEHKRLDAEDEQDPVPRRPGWVRQFDEEDIVARFYVRLLKHERAPSVFELGNGDAGVLLKHATALKERGVKFFQAKRYKLARHQFKRGLTFSNALKDAADDRAPQGHELTLSFHLNTAACALKEADYNLVVTACTEALKLDPRNVKALYRRAQAYAQLVKWENADADLAFAIEIDPNNKAVRSEIQAMKKRRVEQKSKERTVFNNMFGRIIEKDDAERKARMAAIRKANQERKKALPSVDQSEKQEDKEEEE